MVSGREDMKKAIMEYGGLGIHYHSDAKYYNFDYAAQYCDDYKPQDHAVVIVGWNDDFPKENFETTPPGDGAWLVRNSWGTGHGINGYFWLSYYDTTATGNRVYRAVAADKYDNNYRYDKTVNDAGYLDGAEGGSIEAVNVFEIQNEQELLKAVQFGIQWTNLKYSIQIYKNPVNEKEPDTGEPLLEEPIQGSRSRNGHYTIDLGKTIKLKKGDQIAVSVTFTSDNPSVIPAAQIENYAVSKEGRSMYRINDGEWKQCSEEGVGNFLIRAFTKNVTDSGTEHVHEWDETWSYNDNAHWHECKGDSSCTSEEGRAYEKHQGGTATCSTRAICDICGYEYGQKDAANHTGGKIRRNVVEATTTKVGYTGDLCCAGCNVIFETGEEIPMLDSEGSSSAIKRVPNLDYTFRTLDEESVSSKANGKPKLIVFYGAGCGHCIYTLESFTEKTVDGIDVLAVEVKNSSKDKINALKDRLGVGKENIQFCYDLEFEAALARNEYEKTFNGMTYSSLPVLCYIDENDQITYMTAGEQTLTQIKRNLAIYCNLKTTNLNLKNPSSAVFTTIDGEEISLTAEEQPKVLIFYEGQKTSARTLQSISAEVIPGVDIYALDVISQTEEIARQFAEQYISDSSGIKVCQGQDSILEMIKYTEAAGETGTITYPVICYIDADNQLQQVTIGESNLAEVKLNLISNCGYIEKTEEEIPEQPEEPEVPVDPEEPEIPVDPEILEDPDIQDPEVPEIDEVIRISGTDRYETAYKVADAYKTELGIEKFDAVIIATGLDYADALSGSYLAAVKHAPILLTNGEKTNVETLHNYIEENLNKGSTIYILGGVGAVPANAASIEGYIVKRLGGADRYETNLAILEAAGITETELIVAAGADFADSLSVSAAKRPILLVKPDSELNDAQKAVAGKVKGGKIYVAGGKNAVSEVVAEQLADYAEVERVAGADRYETSVRAAEIFFADADTVILANAKNYPDGLCGGPLAAVLNAPVLLAADDMTIAARNYVAAKDLKVGIVLGGINALSEESVEAVFDLKSAEEI